MAWNKYYIAVTDAANIAHEDILAKLGLNGFIPGEEVTFIMTNKSEDLFIGHYGNTLVIADPALTYEFFNNDPSAFEQRFLAAFPGSEIAALMENSTVGQFGYAVYKNGTRIRIKDGADGEIYHDTGSKLPEEEVILSGQIFSPEEIEEMQEDMGEEETQKMIEFEASWRVPRELSKRYFGITIDKVDMSQFKMIRYRKA